MANLAVKSGKLKREGEESLAHNIDFQPSNNKDNDYGLGHSLYALYKPSKG